MMGIFRSVQHTDKSKMNNVIPLALDRLSSLLERSQVSAHLFHTGALCGVTSFDAQAGRGFVHVLRKGRMVVTHNQGANVPHRIEVNQPTLIFYPQPLTHQFHNAPVDGSDFTCASVHFEGGANHPLVKALPPLIVIPLLEVPSLSGALDLLFQEADQVRCGHRLLADRLFEVVLLLLLRWLLDHGKAHGVSIGLVSGLADPKLARALTAMHESPQVAWSLEGLAERAAMSRSAFASRLKEVVGLAPTDYLTEWRLTLAKKWLQQGRAVKLIAPDLGYANASALSRVFSQRTGMSTRQWLAQSQGTGR